MNKNSELSKHDIISVFKANFSFPLIETPLGTAIQIPAREAFIFCNVTGSGYLDNFVFPFSPKGLMKLFYNAFDFKFVSGVFEKNSLRYTPFLLSKAKPFLFDSQYKYIVPVEFNSEIELQSILENVFNKLEKPTDYIVMRVEKSKKGNGLENLMVFTLLNWQCCGLTAKRPYMKAIAIIPTILLLGASSESAARQRSGTIKQKIER